MIKQLLIAFSLVLIPLSAYAVCPDHKVTLCEIVQDNTWVLRATVESTQYIKDEDDLEGIAGWLYNLKITTDYRGKKTKHLSVRSENTTARVNLETGKKYFIFASENTMGVPETGNYCDNFTESYFSTALEEQIKSCIRTEKH